MKLFKLVLFACILATTSCCSDKLQSIEEKYENGETKLEYSQDKDGNKQGVLLSYYETGEVSSRASYINGLIDGELIKFYKNGQIKSKLEYSNGEKHGSAKWYYNDGMLEYKGNYCSGEKCSDAYFYRQDGLLSTYIYYHNKTAAIAYRRRYTNSGEVLSQEGEIFGSVEVNEVEFQIGDTLSLKVYAVNPPNTSSKLRVELTDSSATNVDVIPIKNIGGYTYQANKELTQVGQYKVVCVLDLLEDSLSQRDTFNIDINVVGAGFN